MRECLNRTTAIPRFEHCQKQTYDLTVQLADEYSKEDPGKAKTLRAYARSMDRRLKSIEAMKSGNTAEVANLLQKAIDRSLESHPPK